MMILIFLFNGHSGFVFCVLVFVPQKDDQHREANTEDRHNWQNNEEINQRRRKKSNWGNVEDR